MDVIAVHEAARYAVEHIRAGQGPFFLEFRTYRFRAHSMFDPQLYRCREEVEQWKTRGPIHTYSTRLKAEGLLDEPGFLAILAQVDAEVEDAIAFAEKGTWEPIEDLSRDVYTPGPAPEPAP
jgi:pyruvate dehydrogenase E1 component alpha subunit